LRYDPWKAGIDHIPFSAAENTDVVPICQADLIRAFLFNLVDLEKNKFRQDCFIGGSTLLSHNKIVLCLTIFIGRHLFLSANAELPAFFVK
jgi:hypothetical protein